MNTTIEETNPINYSEDHTSTKKNLFQIDFLKALMMGLVIMDHAFTHRFLHSFGSTFWERISIPVLMIIMGFNLGNSYKHKEYKSLKEYYSKSYFKHKLKRYILPYLGLYLIHGIIRIIVIIGNISVNGVFYYDKPIYRYFGYTFFYGPGMWFIPVLFGTILIFPLLYYVFDKSPTATLVGMYVIEFFTYLLMGALGGLLSKPDLPTFILFTPYSMFSAIGLGLWLSKNYELFSKRNLIIWILFPISLTFMIIYNIVGEPFTWFGDYHMFFFPYSAMIVMIALKFLPQNPDSTISRIISKIGKSTYHILLVQIFYYSIIYQFFLTMYDGNVFTPDVFDANPINYLWYYPVSLIITFSLGVLWKSGEDKFWSKLKNENKYQKFNNLIIKVAVVAYIAWYIIRGLYLFII